MLNNFCPCSNLTVYGQSFFAHPLSVYVPFGISFGNKKPDNVDRDYIVLLSNLIEEGIVQCIAYSGVARSSYRLATLLVRTGTP